jgi:molecular chaperone DnaK (HSP70)
MSGYVGIDLGGKQVKIGIADTASSINQYEQFTSWVYSEDGVAYVGEGAVTLGTNQQNPDEHYSNFLHQIDQAVELGQLAGVKVTALDLVKIIFRKAVLMREYITRADQCVAVVPAYMNQEQKIATSIAAKRAGLRLSAVISQGVAKAIALQNKYSLPVGHVFAIYEWGASQFEFSIFRVLNNNGLEVLTTTSLEQVGGYQCDQRLWQIVAEKYKLKRGKELVNNRVSMLDSHVIGTKEGLNTRADRSVEINNITLDVSRWEFEDRVRSLINETIECAKKAIRTANLPVSEIKDIYLTGGSSQILAVSTAVKETFASKITLETQSQLAAQGAVMFGQLYLTQSNSREIHETGQTSHVMILSRSLFHYGLVTSIYDLVSKSDKDQNSVVIQKNLPLPLRKSAVFSTDEPWQKIIAYQVTYSKSDTKNLAEVQKYEPILLEFDSGVAGLVEIQLDLWLTEDHTLRCELENHQTGESRVVECENEIIKRYSSFKDAALQVR